MDLLSDSINKVNSLQNEGDPINIAMVGKYVTLADSYVSVNHALKHAAASIGKKITIDWIDSENINGNVDTLISGFTFNPDASVMDTLSLDEEAFELLNRSPNWIQPQVRIVSSGDQPVRFLSTDTLTITIDGISASIDLSNLVSGD